MDDNFHIIHLIKLVAINYDNKWQNLHLIKQDNCVHNNKQETTVLTINQQHISELHIIHKAIVVHANRVMCANPSHSGETEFLSLFK